MNNAIDKVICQPKKVYTFTIPTTYYPPTQNINEKQFSRRELDVIACIISGRTPKKIASLLSIVPRTVESHIYNIKTKLGCNARDNIIDFIEKTDHYPSFKRHYSTLLSRESFDKKLEKIAKWVSKSEFQLCMLVDNKKDENTAKFIQTLLVDLSYLGIKIIIFDKNDSSSDIYVNIENIQKMNVINSYQSILILVEDNSKSKQGDWDTLIGDEFPTKSTELVGVQEYFYLFFQILKKMFPLQLEKLNAISLDFYNHCSTNVMNAGSSPSTRENLNGSVNQSHNHSYSQKQRDNWFFQYRNNKVLSIVCAIILIILGLGSLQYVPHFLSSTSHKGSTSTVRWNLPRQDHVFVGRVSFYESLRDILEKRFERKHGSEKENEHLLTVSACAGMGGIGKTQLALQYAYHTKHPYTLIAWLPSENLDELRQKIVELSHFLGLNKKDISEKDAVFNVKQWLNDNPGWLLIFDNVKGYNEIQPFLPEYGGNVILTTRNRNWPTKFKVIDIDVMSEEDAILLLKSLIQFPIQENFEDEAREMVKVLGYLPLSISQAGAYINQNRLSLSEYLKLYKLSEHQVMASEILPMGTNALPVATTWNISLRHIIKEAIDKNDPPISIEILLACAYFSSDKIPRPLLLSWFKHVYPNLTDPEFALSRSIAMLWKYSLINIGNDNTISIHRLLQSVLRHQHQSKDSRGQENEFYPKLDSAWFKSLFNSIHQEFIQESNISSDVIRRQQALLPHLQSLLNHYEHCTFAREKLMELALSELLYDLGIIYDRLVLSNDSIRYFKRALAIKEQFYGIDHIKTVPTLLRLGMAYKTSGNDIDAKTILERVIRLQNRDEINQHSDLNCLAMSSLGVVYGNLGDYEKANELQSLSIKVQEERYGPNNPYIARTLLCLCETLGNLGKPSEQIMLSKRVLQLFEKNKDESYHMGSVYYCLGCGYKALGDLKRAQREFEKSLEIRIKFFGKHHHWVGKTLKELGSVYCSLGKHHNAKSILENALKITIDSRGENHYETAQALVNLAIVYKKLGRMDQAANLLKRSIDIYSQHYGSVHAETTKLRKELDSIIATKYRLLFPRMLDFYY